MRSSLEEMNHEELINALTGERTKLLERVNSELRTTLADMRRQIGRMSTENSELHDENSRLNHENQRLHDRMQTIEDLDESQLLKDLQRCEVILKAILEMRNRLESPTRDWWLAYEIIARVEQFYGMDGNSKVSKALEERGLEQVPT